MIGNRRITGFLFLNILFLLFFCVGVGSAQGDTPDGWARAKGIFLDRVDAGGSRQAAQFYVVLPADGRRVSTEHEFRSGDRLQFQFALKRSAYVYVLNSTIRSDDPAALHLARNKGIVRVQPDGQVRLVSSDRFRVLLPMNSTTQTRTPEGVTTDGAVFVMDEETGLELLTIVVAPGPLDVGRMAREVSTPEDTMESALANIREGSLSVWAANCEVSLAPAEGYQSGQLKGIQPAEKESYVVARDVGRPFAFQIALQHLPR